MNLYEKMQLGLSEFDVEQITIDNMGKYEDVFYCNNEYYIITDGQPATRETCVDTIKYCPENFPAEKIYNIGVLQEGIAVCTLFILYGYPNEQTVYIGLFLMNPKFKRKGIGTKVIKTLLDCFSNSIIEKFCLSVQDNNISGCSFWKSLGFCVVNQSLCEGFVNLSMQYELEKQ